MRHLQRLDESAMLGYDVDGLKKIGMAWEEAENA